jgi:hypothetical protein
LRAHAEDTWLSWSDPATWADTLDHPANPLNLIAEEDAKTSKFIVIEKQTWRGALPGDGDDVWIPSWKRVLLDVSTRSIGRLVVEGTLVINGTDSVNLTATYVEIKGGKVSLSCFCECVCILCVCMTPW